MFHYALLASSLCFFFIFSIKRGVVLLRTVPLPSIVSASNHRSWQLIYPTYRFIRPIPRSQIASLFLCCPVVDTNKTFMYAHACTHFIAHQTTAPSSRDSPPPLSPLPGAESAACSLRAHHARSEPQPQKTEVGKEHRARADTHGGHRVLASMA